MTSDDRPAEPAPDEMKSWVDGLAGRPGGGHEHAEGQGLRRALFSLQDASGMAAWDEIERQARQPDASSSGLAEQSDRGPAANQPLWRALQGLAAVLVLGLALVFALRPAPEVPALRGMEGATPAGAVWRTEQPAAAAERLAADLTALGAQVSRETVNDGRAVLLRLTVPAAARPAVNARLTEIEAALDAQGRLELRVTAPQADGR